MAAVHAEVKKRLDYQVSLQNAYKRVEREQAISYILDGVKGSIGPAQVNNNFFFKLRFIKNKNNSIFINLRKKRISLQV